MKKCIMLIVAIWSIAGLKAQTFEVTSFKELENDVTASFGDNARQKNGKKCAIIKVKTLEKDFSFDFGSILKPVDVVYRQGEVWIYTEPGIQRIRIYHKNLGSTEYPIEIPIREGRTYELLLNIGNNRYVTIQSQTTLGPLNGAEIYIDNQHYEGRTPLYNIPLTAGIHTIRVVDQPTKHEGEEQITLTPGKETQTITITMADMSKYYALVNVKTDEKAEIWYGGRKVGTGTWNQELKEGHYTIETRKTNCEPTKTEFTVKGGKPNEIIATAPKPYTGYLHIYTRPYDLNTTYNGNNIFNQQERAELPVGRYQFKFNKKGYVPFEQDYDIERDKSVYDTVKLERISYVKKTAFYFGGALYARSLSGISGIIGAVFNRHDVQASYTFGIASSRTYETQEGTITSNNRVNHKMNTLAFKYGYQFAVLPRIALTPQVGYASHRISTTNVAGSDKYADGATASTLQLGLKATVVPLEHVYGFIAPEFGIMLSKNEFFEKAMYSNKGNFSADGFGIQFGILVNF